MRSLDDVENGKDNPNRGSGSDIIEGEWAVGQGSRHDGDETGGRRLPGRPKDLEKRAAVIESARKLFLAHGLDAVSVDVIASSAGVSKATVYRHFADKESLFDAVVMSEIDKFHYPPLAPTFPGPAEYREFIRELGVLLIGFLSQPADGDLGRLLMIEAKRHPDHAALFIERGPNTTHRWLAALLATGTASGYLEITDTLTASDQLLSMWLGMHNVREQFGVATPRPPEEIAAHVGHCLDMFFRAYAPSAAAGSTPRPKAKKRPKNVN